MKKCPKCSKTYDDSWGVCLSCSTQLEDATGGASSTTTASQNSHYVQTRKKTPPIKYILLMSISFFIKLIILAVNSSIYDPSIKMLLVLVDVVFTGVFVYGAYLWTLNKGYDGFHSIGSFLPILFIPAMFFAPIKETDKKTGWDTALTIFAILGLLMALSYMGQLSQLMPKQ